jgi:hypothetical protein
MSIAAKTLGESPALTRLVVVTSLSGAAFGAGVLFASTAVAAPPDLDSASSDPVCSLALVEGCSTGGSTIGNGSPSTRVAAGSGVQVGPFLGLIGNGIDASPDCVGNACNGGNGGLLWGNGGNGANGGSGGSAFYSATEEMAATQSRSDNPAGMAGMVVSFSAPEERVATAEGVSMASMA